MGNAVSDVLRCSTFSAVEGYLVLADRITARLSSVLKIKTGLFSHLHVIKMKTPL